MWGALIGAGAGLLGSALSSRSANRAAQTSANAQVEAARIAADEARFRPVGITTRFGSSNFGFDENGRLSSAGYTLDPMLAGLRDTFLTQAQNRGMGIADQGYQAGQGLFNLGQGYLAESPEQAAQSWMARQQNLLAPARERSLAGVRNNLFNSGRGGLAVGATGVRPDGSAGLGASNPEMEAYYNAIAQQDAKLAAEAQQQGREQTQFGYGLMNNALGMFSNAYSPFQTQLGLAGTIENLGMDALNAGSALGGRSMQGGATAANALLTGGMGAARTLGSSGGSGLGSTLMGLANNRRFTDAAGSFLGGLFGGGNGNLPTEAEVLRAYGNIPSDAGFWGP